MNKSFSLAGTLTLTAALAACAAAPQRIVIYTEANPPPQRLLIPLSRPNPTNPNVFVTPDNFIVVDQEPIRPPAGDTVVIFFSLDQGTYGFPPDTVSASMRGIIIKELPNVCKTQTQNQVKCKYQRPSAGTVYHYTVNVIDTSGGPPPTPLDPSIMN